MCLSFLLWFSYTSKDFNEGYKSKRRLNIFKSFGEILKEQLSDPFVEFGKNLAGSDILNIGDTKNSRKPLIEDLDRTPIQTVIFEEENNVASSSRKNEYNSIEPKKLDCDDDEVKIVIKMNFSLQDELDLTNTAINTNLGSDFSVKPIHNKLSSDFSVKPIHINKDDVIEETKDFSKKWLSSIELDKPEDKK